MYTWFDHIILEITWQQREINSSRELILTLGFFPREIVVLSVKCKFNFSLFLKSFTNCLTPDYFFILSQTHKQINKQKSLNYQNWIWQAIPSRFQDWFVSSTGEVHSSLTHILTLCLCCLEYDILILFLTLLDAGRLIFILFLVFLGVRIILISPYKKV